MEQIKSEVATMNYEKEITQNQKSHQISASNRLKMNVTGVCDVISFDEQCVVLNTVCGSMTIDGDQLHIHVLDTQEGTVSMEGRIDSIVYLDNEQTKDTKGGFWGRLLR